MLVKFEYKFKTLEELENILYNMPDALKERGSWWVAAPTADGSIQWTLKLNIDACEVTEIECGNHITSTPPRDLLVNIHDCSPH